MALLLAILMVVLLYLWYDYYRYHQFLVNRKLCLDQELNFNEDHVISGIYTDLIRVPTDIKDLRRSADGYNRFLKCLQYVNMDRLQTNDSIYLGFYVGNPNASQKNTINIEDHGFVHHSLRSKDSLRINLIKYSVKSAMYYFNGAYAYKNGRRLSDKSFELHKAIVFLWNAAPKALTDSMTCGVVFDKGNEGDGFVIHCVENSSGWVCSFFEKNYKEIQCNEDEIISFYQDHLNATEVYKSDEVDEVFVTLVFRASKGEF